MADALDLGSLREPEMGSRESATSLFKLIML